MHEWTVAGAVVEGPEGLLLVRNQRRYGIDDWSPPGGVIDADDATILQGLTREVEEETGLRVTDWAGPLYEVRAIAHDLGWSMRCEVYYAIAYEGDLNLADPDGIVVDAAFVAHDACDTFLATGALWVREPLNAWIVDRWSAEAPRSFDYEVRGSRLDALDVRLLRAG